MRRWSMSGAVVGVAVLLIVVGGTYALASSSNSTITVCVSHKGGSLYRARKCAKGDRKLTWNTQGRQGPTGQAGPPGSTGSAGPQGTPGASNAVSGSIAGPVTITSAITPGDGVGHLILSPGSYVIFAKVWIENQSTTTATTAGCTLDAGADSDVDTLKLEPSGTNAFRGAVALNLAHTFTSASTVQLSCATGAGVTVTANNAVVTAIQVGSLTGGALIAG